MKKSELVLKSGKRFNGVSPLWQNDNFHGEVVFTTGMVGYIETLTDPSYTGQIIVFTYPLIGNYGIPEIGDWESKKIHASGVVISEACDDWSHHSGKKSLLNWLKEQNVPLITDVDTRSLTKLLREHGVMLGSISNKSKSKIKFIDPNEGNLVESVTTNEKEILGKGNKKIIVVDCGMKENIIRSLSKFPIEIQRVPFDYDYTKEDFDGVFISNGPGDPIKVNKTTRILRKAMKLEKPIFGICLGSQLIALAAGAKAYKLKYGHRGQNQPCIDTKTKHCYVTSQNHGFAIKEETLPDDWYVNFRNLNDNSVEGVSHKKLPFFGVQFHPEASPGPADTSWLFDKFYNLL